MLTLTLIIGILMTNLILLIIVVYMLDKINSNLKVIYNYLTINHDRYYCETEVLK